MSDRNLAPPLGGDGSLDAEEAGGGWGAGGIGEGEGLFGGAFDGESGVGEVAFPVGEAVGVFDLIGPAGFAGEGEDGLALGGDAG